MRRLMHHYRGRHHGPPAFVRRAGCAFASMIVIAATAAGALVSRFSGLTMVVAAAVTIGIAVAFALTLRRVARYFAQQVRLRRQLMADVAHELRTPLAILQGRIEGLLDGVYPRDDQRLGELLAETQHLSRLVEDVRTLANAEAGALELRREPVDVAELVREAAVAVGSPISMNVGNTPPIDADPVRIREVFLNLLTNAAQHAAGAEVLVSSETRSDAIVIRVRDHGPGIPPDELAHLFERFRKGPRSQGTGLGLSIARRLVLAHDGTIGVESRAGKGTVVTVTLPR